MVSIPNSPVHFSNNKNMAISIVMSDSSSLSKLPPVIQPYNDANEYPMKDDRDQFKSFDEVESPFTLELESEDDKLFATMKHEINRLNSFAEKWPLVYVKPADLAEAGFFYLQSDDKVQCAFCRVVMDRWTEGQKPLREHMRKSPKCNFLVCGDKNVPILHHKPKSTSVVPPVPVLPSVQSTPCIPKNPRMADMANRLESYNRWPRIMLTPRQLAECGLYYSGIQDIVTCFFCGGSLGNWEVDDDPWVEHEKFFPKCSFLRLMRNSGKIPPKPKSHSSATSYSNSVHRAVIRQACEIFPRDLVEKVAMKRMSERAPKFSSLQELVDDIMEMKDQENRASMLARTEMGDMQMYAQSARAEDISETMKPKEVNNALLCKICMDKEMGVVFQPCGHLVACPRCSDKLNDCPVCRKPIINKVRTYLS